MCVCVRLGPARYILPECHRDSPAKRGSGNTDPDGEQGVLPLPAQQGSGRVVWQATPPQKISSEKGVYTGAFSLKRIGVLLKEKIAPKSAKSANLSFKSPLSKPF